MSRIDELVMIRVKDKGDLYVHQDANWNVIGILDSPFDAQRRCRVAARRLRRQRRVKDRHVVERSIYTPYGELTVHQDTGFGDRDGDQDVDSTDKGTVGSTCTGTVTGSCRILDLVLDTARRASPAAASRPVRERGRDESRIDGDYDSTDATKFDALTQGTMRHPGRPATNVSQPFAHQGLLFEPELAQYQNRARQYDPGKRRFGQRDPLGLEHDAALHRNLGVNAYVYTNANPVAIADPTGLWGCLTTNLHFTAVTNRDT